MHKSVQTASVIAAGRSESRYSRSCRLTDLSLEATAVLRGGGLVGRDVVGEFVPARTVRPQHEIDGVGAGGIERRLDRSHARVGNRTGRQARVPVGIVRILAFQVGPVDRAAIPAVEQRG